MHAAVYIMHSLKLEGSNCVLFHGDVPISVYYSIIIEDDGFDSFFGFFEYPSRCAYYSRCLAVSFSILISAHILFRLQHIDGGD